MVCERGEGGGHFGPGQSSGLVSPLIKWLGFHVGFRGGKCDFFFPFFPLFSARGEKY